jgi:cell division protein FtsW
VSAGTLSLGRFGGAARGRSKPKRRSRRAVSTEYNMLLTATLCLLALGAVMVFSASSTTQVLHDGGLANSAYYLKRTLIFGAIGLVIMHVTARYGLGAIRRLTPLLLGASLFLLVAVLGAGQTVNGASRWIGSGSLQIQPSELAKVALILYGADMLARKPKRARSIEGFMPFLLVTAAACLLILLEPDMGTAMVIVFAVGATLIAAGARPRDLGMIALAIGGLALLMTIVEPYRMARLTGFLNPGAAAEGAGFQAAQAKIALGSGGLFGVGIGNGVQKAFYLPEAHTDMISAVIGEELGMVGIVGVVGLFGMLGYAGLKVAQRAKDNYGKLLVAGLTSLILVQATINLFAVMGLAPLTGVPLPFVSYGNSSLMATLFAVGLILNVARGGTAAAAGSGRSSSTRRSATRGPARSGGRAGQARSSGAGKLRVVEGGRTPARKRSGSNGVRKAKGGGGGGGNRGPRRSRHGGRRRASG